MAANIKQGWMAYLASLGPLKDLVGDRIYPEAAPETAGYPRVVVTQSEGDLLPQLGGPASPDGGNGWATFQTACWGATYADAEACARAVKGLDQPPGHRLEDFRGLMGSVAVQYVRATDSVDSDAPPLHGESMPTFTVTLTVRIFYEE